MIIRRTTESSSTSDSDESDDASDSQTYPPEDESSVVKPKKQSGMKTGSVKAPDRNASKGVSLADIDQKYPSDMIMETSDDDPTSDDISSTDIPPRKSATTATTKVAQQAHVVLNDGKGTDKASLSVSLATNNLQVPLKAMPLKKPSDDSFDVSELSEDDISVDSHRGGSIGNLVPKSTLLTTSNAHVARKSTGEIAPSALKPLSKSSSKAASTQSVNFKFNSDPVETLVKTTAFGSVPTVPVAAKPQLATDSEVSEFLSEFTDSEDSRDRPTQKSSSLDRVESFKHPAKPTGIQAKANARHHVLDEFDIDTDDISMESL
ncbi:hypothetical protein BDR26DRAFT_426803 [Obelidium mucronatum]|nr:hypothetical protein BDR26DRAFT_426803 [Obelidium mucronatum]